MESLSLPVLTEDTDNSYYSSSRQSPLSSALSSSPLIRYNSQVEKLKETQSSTFLQALFNGINLLAGLGILSLPFAFREAGWAVGLGLLLYFCLITNYTGKLIGECMAIPRKKIESFPDLGYAAFGLTGQVTITIVLCIELMGALAIFIVLMGDNLHKIFPSVDRNVLCGIATLCVWPTCLTNRLHLLSNLSVIGIVATLLLLIVLIETGFAVPRTNKVGSFYTIKTSELDPVNDGIMYALGIIMAGFAGHAVFPSIYESMRDKTQFPRLMDRVYIICLVIYALMAIIGYLLFRKETEEEITLNLYDISGKSLAVNVTVWLIIINPFTKFPLTLNPLACLVETLLLNYSAEADQWTLKRQIIKLFIRTVLTLCALFLAVALPGFAFICSFIGAFCSFIVSAIFPISCYLKLFPAISVHRRIINHLLIYTNCVLCVLGTLAVFFHR